MRHHSEYEKYRVEKSKKRRAETIATGTYHIRVMGKDIKGEPFTTLVCNLYENQDWWLLTVTWATGFRRTGFTTKRRGIYRAPLMKHIDRARDVFFEKHETPFQPHPSIPKGKKQANTVARLYLPKDPANMKPEFPYVIVRKGYKDRLVITDGRLPEEKHEKKAKKNLLDGWLET